MEKFLVPLKPSPENPKPGKRRQWKRSLIELNGRLEPKYQHDLVSTLLLHNYSEVAAFPHLYHVNGAPCRTHNNLVGGVSTMDQPSPLTKEGISAVKFDNKGVYMASVTKSGCLTVHDVEALSGNMDAPSSCLKEDETNHVLHLSVNQQLDALCWNPINQDEVACVSVKSNEVLVYDISYISSEPDQVLKARRTTTVHGSDIHKGLTDITFTAVDESRLIASDTNGTINVWDRRMSIFPCLEFTSNSRSTINSIQLNQENQLVFGAGRNGIVYMWDLRGGRTSAAFHVHKESSHPPTTSWKLASLLEQISTLKAQSNIVMKEVHSIDFNPSCPFQLSFHLDDGWSGILDIHRSQVTHVHCPPPAWLSGPNVSSDMLYLRKPSWLPTYSIYVVGSSSANGIYLLDFYPDRSAPCHVDYREDAGGDDGMRYQRKQNRFIPSSERVTVCATHPVNGTIVAGTKNSSLLLVSVESETMNQRQHAENEDY